MTLNLRLSTQLLGPSREAVLVRLLVPGDTAVRLGVGSVRAGPVISQLSFAVPRDESVARLDFSHLNPRSPQREPNAFT